VSLESIRAAFRDIPDFPAPGIVFRDISPVLQDGQLFHELIDLVAAPHLSDPPDRIAAIDARGFVFGAAVAYRLGCGLAMIRKKGKLPWKTHAISYDLEYGSNEMEIHLDAVRPGEDILVIDDVLATGGTAAAALRLVEQLGGQVRSVDFVVELVGLPGRDLLAGYTVNSLLKLD